MKPDSIIYRVYNIWQKIHSSVFPKLFPYSFRPERYTQSFLTNGSTDTSIDKEMAPVSRVIYCFWTGDNEMSANRKKAFDSLVADSGVEVRLITQGNWGQYILAEDPLPQCFPMLSDVHKADYLRTYFMHHYGGGYSDIKCPTHSWAKSFDLVDANSNDWLLGYQELSYKDVGNAHIKDKALKRDLWVYHKNLVGNCAYICRPGTPFTEEWLNEAKHRLEELTPILYQHPALDPYGKNADYPVPWTYILGEIFHPLCLKYHNKILKSDEIKPIFNQYR